MPKVLTDKQIAAYAENGFLSPFTLCSPAEAGTMHDRFEDMERTLGEEPQKRFRVKAHLPFPWLCDLISHPRLLDAVEDLIGPDILCWGSSFFTKKAADPRFISWHTDTFYYSFDPAETLTAWFSFNDATVESGCMRYIPGSHKETAIHDFFPDANNLAGQGQTARDVDESRAADAVLRAGEVVFHHESVIHGSQPNNSDHPRVGFSIHYCAPHVRETRFDGATALLLRGTDTHGYWDPDPMPKQDFDPDCIQWMLDYRARFKAASAQKVVAGVRS
jgi:non-heme Fe2+,alpha-ketoglutarate-dependent halogenase